MLIAGIDPGANGAIAVLDSENPDSVALLDLKKRNTVTIHEWLVEELDYKPSTFWIEDIHSMYGMSAKSNFSFGKNLGIVTAIAELFNHDLPNTVTPKVWQKYIGVTAKGKAVKQQVAKIAQYLYPQAELHGKRGGLLDGRSDALMIAYYGLHNLKEKV
ncbi:uncharacterized protein METZ01_LOCUS274312 [marine metagenome]|uniref:Uncharacterized protein n=1 Tax=marine metagenome TaxID=408172 RepID=A0A382KAS7_9ZZZZ